MRLLRRAAPGLMLVLLLSSAAPGQDAREQDSDDVPRLPMVAPDEARQREELLDRLFGRLRSVASDREGKVVEETIWQAWMHSGSPTADLLLQQAVKSMNARRYDRALDILNVIIDERPEFAEAWNKRATVYYVIGKHDRSLSDIDKVLELEPRHFGALSGLGMIRRDKGDRRGALEAFRQALGINPHMSTIRQAAEALEKELEQGI